MLLGQEMRSECEKFSNTLFGIETQIADTHVSICFEMEMVRECLEMFPDGMWCIIVAVNGSINVPTLPVVSITSGQLC